MKTLLCHLLSVTFLITMAASTPLINYDQIGVNVNFTVNNVNTFRDGKPCVYRWNFGNGESSTDPNPSVIYDAPNNGAAIYVVDCTLTGADGATEEIQAEVRIDHFDYPKKLTDNDVVRFAQFNTAFSDHANNREGVLESKLHDPQWMPAKRIADVIQKNRPDVLSLQEFDHKWVNNDTWDEMVTRQMVENFQRNFLAIAQANDNDPIYYEHVFVAPCNTGIQSGFDLNKNGIIGDIGDAFGYGSFPGAYGMVLLSKYPIDYENVRTFQNFLWKDMPGAMLPHEPGTGDMYYTKEELNVLRLPSKSHWDLPIQVANGNIIHVLMSHPTPPVFDDGVSKEYPSTEVIDWNGLRNNNEIRFWADYIDPKKSGYIYDDLEWKAAGGKTPPNPSGGLNSGTRFVILGDQNCDPIDGDSTFAPINRLLQSQYVDASSTPRSFGGEEQTLLENHDRDTKTTHFDLRADYILPSLTGLEIIHSYVHWPEKRNVESYLLDASDHLMVVVDVKAVKMEIEDTVAVSSN